MLAAYLDWVRAWPLSSAMVQFAVLGTLGDGLAACLLARRWHLPFGPGTLLLKAVKWAALAVPIKLAFIGFAGFVAALLAHGYLPDGNALLAALATSLAINLQFGPLLVLTHRWLNNRIMGGGSWAGIRGALWSLAWFWIPAHTLTFLLPADLRIGLAALWSLLLGLLLGGFAQAGTRLHN